MAKRDLPGPDLHARDEFFDLIRSHPFVILSIDLAAELLFRGCGLVNYADVNVMHGWLPRIDDTNDPDEFEVLNLIRRETSLFLNLAVSRHFDAIFVHRLHVAARAQA